MNPKAYDEMRARTLNAKTDESELIVYEDAHFLVLNKPYDLQIDGKRPLSALRLLKRFRPNLSRLRFCHQLDYATSGLLLLAKCKEAASAAGRLFEERKVEKEYRAILMGHVDQEEWVDAAISSDLERHKMRLCSNGKRSQTLIQPLQRGWRQEDAVTYVRMIPITGRRHQLRLHAVKVGHPIVGDITYAKDFAPPRMMLHAYGLSLPLPPPFQEIQIVRKDNLLSPSSFIQGER